MVKILFLQTKQNMVWTSMEEILPHIQSVWEIFCEKNGYEMVVADVDNVPPHQYIKDVLTCTHLVASAFNLHIVNALGVIRGRLGVNAPLYFYLHNQATIGLWPLVHFELFCHMRETDVFMGTCPGDEACMKFLGLSCERTLFGTMDNAKTLPALREEKIEDIVFVGRISRQKNLHLLILAFNELKKENPALRLHLYGKEDNLGSPSMEFRKPGYLEELKALGGEDIFFHGFVKRETIKEELKKKPFVFCSPSLHNDENFGMAALMALESGGRAVLSHWGGHQNFIYFFPDRVFSVPVGIEKFGPFLCIDELLKSLRLSLSGKAAREVNSPFHRDQIVANLKLKTEKGGELLVTPPLTKELLRKRVENEGEGPTKIFNGYGDPDCHKFFKAYGAKEMNYPVKELYPWVHQEKDQYIIDDPHRGHFVIDKNESDLFGCGWP